jgi:Ribosomal protein S17
MAGIVKSTKMNRTIIVRRNYFHFIPKYQRCVVPRLATFLPRSMRPRAAAAPVLGSFFCSPWVCVAWPARPTRTCLVQAKSALQAAR